jgi:hypothetical protein
MDNGTKRQRDHRTMDNLTTDHPAMDNGTLGQWKSENMPRKQFTWDTRILGNWDSGAKEQWDNGTLDTGTVDK